MQTNSAGPPRAFHIMAKPAGSLCNLDCAYCFYLEKEKLYPETRRWAMTDDVLEAYVKQFIESQDVPVVHFAWQGGEPTTLGVEFFRKAVAFQQKYANGKEIANAFQTNGVLLDDGWGSFLAEHHFLVGLSIDGPRNCHDHFRVDKGGNPTFDRVMKGLEVLKRHKVEFNTLTCVQRHNAKRPLEVYRFLKEIGSGFLQFIPIVERGAAEPSPDGLVLVSPDTHAEARVTPWSVVPEDYGSFLCAVFDEWVRRDVGRYFVQIFDIALEAWMGYEPSLCVFRPTCGDALAIEHNGDLYSCDHYVYPENKLGNIMEQAMESMVYSDQQRSFGDHKQMSLPAHCRSCSVRFTCNGECPKHRFIRTPEGEEGLNYLCAGYKRFFTHIAPYMQFMAGELHARRPPANVMAWVARRDLKRTGRRTPGPNDPCACGSGRKYKKCCGRKR